MVWNSGCLSNLPTFSPLTQHPLVWMEARVQMEVGAPTSSPPGRLLACECLAQCISGPCMGEGIYLLPLPLVSLPPRVWLEYPPVFPYGNQTALPVEAWGLWPRFKFHIILLSV